ncbi:MAG: 5-(carboxyamino)imidazole ribonucleotide synthase [Halobacteriales archaeon]
MDVPGATLGVVGGGQLGRMMGEAAAPLGVDVVVLDPADPPPAAPVVSDWITADFDDKKALERLAKRSDVLTFEIELADPYALEHVENMYDVEVHPRPDTLRRIEDKLEQNRLMEDAGVPTPDYREVDSKQELRSALDELGYPAMLKARRGGYDGRGTVLVRRPDDVEEAFDAVAGPALVEEYVEFDRELAVMVARGDGEKDAYEVTETIHREEILRESVTPARTTEDVRDSARDVAEAVVDELDGRGVYGVELFEVDGQVLYNEVAPRPHNSGHWTIEGAATSQFEQHVRAVLGLPLGSTGTRGPTVTANVLGDVDVARRASLEGVDGALSTSRAHLHWYGKREVRRLRKMGHLTLSSESGDRDDMLSRARETRDKLSFD